MGFLQSKKKCKKGEQFHTVRLVTLLVKKRDLVAFGLNPTDQGLPFLGMHKK